jgi:hypothetical protein
MYTPTKDKVDESYKMLEISKENVEAETGISIANKSFVSLPTLKQAMDSKKIWKYFQV